MMQAYYRTIFLFVKNNLLFSIFIFGLLLLPLIWWPKAEIPFEIPKVWFFLRWVETLAIFGVWHILKNQSGLTRKKGDRMLILLVFAFFSVAVITSLLGVDFNKSFWGNYYRQDGLLTLFHLVALFFFLNLFWEKFWEKPVILAISFGCLLTSLWTTFLGIRFHLLKDPAIYHFGRAIGATFGQPNFLAGYLLVCLPLLADLVTKAKNQGEKHFWLTGLIFQFMAIFLTLSWAGILGIFLFFALRFGLVRFQLNLRNSLVVLTVILLVIGGILFVWKPAQVDEHYPESRTRIIGRGLIAFTKKPILGWGWANFDYAFEAIDWPMKFVPDIYVDKAHSHLLEALVTTGIVGFLIYLAIIILVLRKIWSQQTWLLVFLLFLFHSQTNVISINEELIFWLILGIVTGG